MISLFLILLELCSSASAYKIQWLEIYAGWPTRAVEEKQAAEREEYENKYAGCLEEFGKTTCDMIYGVLPPKMYCNEATLNNALSSMESGVQILMVTSYGCPETIDFNKLPRKIPFISLGGLVKVEYDQGRTLSSLPVQLALKKEMMKIAKDSKNISANEAFDRINRIITNDFSMKETKVVYPTLYVQGGIKDKVSYLLITARTLKVVGSPLDCENIYRSWVDYSLSSQIVKPTYLIIPDSRFVDINWKYEEPDQMIILLVSVTRYTRISYKTTSWDVICDNSNSFTSYNRVTYNFPYAKINKLGVLSMGCLNYDIFLSGSDGVLKDVNITVGVSTGSPSAKALANTRSTETIAISATGWEDSEYKPKVTVTASSDSYTIDASSAKDVGIDVTVKEPVKLESSSGGGSNGGGGGGGSVKSSETDIGMIIGVVISVLVAVGVSAVVAVVIYRTYKNDASEANA